MRLKSAACVLLTVALVLGMRVSPLAAQEAGGEKVTYADHVLPLFRQRCGSCHNSNDRKGGLVLDNYAGAISGGSSGPVLVGGDSGSSYLWNLVNRDSQPFMPPMSDKLPDAELAVIRRWIDQGLLENSGSEAKLQQKSSIGQIQVTGKRPDVVAFPQGYLGGAYPSAPRANAVTALAVSPWAPLAAVSGHLHVALYHTVTHELLGQLPFPEGQPQILKFSRDGSLLLVGGGRGGASGRVVVFDVTTGERKIEVGEEYDAVLAADISPDHSRIALGGPKKLLRVYSTATGELLHESNKHTDWVTAIEYSPDGVLLASADRSNGLHIWEAVSGRPFHDLTGHKGAIADVSWRLDSNLLASASEDGTIRMWEMNDGTQVRSADAHGGVLAVDFTRDGRLVTTGRDKTARLWDAEGKQLAEFGPLDDLGLEIAFDAENNLLLAGDLTGSVRIFDADKKSETGRLSTNPPALAALIESLEKQLAESAGGEGQNKLTEENTAGLHRRLEQLRAAQAAAP